MTGERSDIDFRWLLFEPRKKVSQGIRRLAVLSHNHRRNALSHFCERLSLRHDQRICMAVGIDKSRRQYIACCVNHRVRVEGSKIALCHNARSSNPHTI